MPTFASIPASTSCESARRRCRGGAVPGSVDRQTSSSSVGTENVTFYGRTARHLGEEVEVADDQRPARDQAEGRRGPSEEPRCRRASAGNGPPPADTGRSRRRS